MCQLQQHRLEQTELECAQAGDGGSPVMQQAERKHARAERGSRGAGRILLGESLWKKGRKSETKEAWILNSFPAHSRMASEPDRRKRGHTEVPDAATMLPLKPALSVEGEHREGRARRSMRKAKV